jgi:uncharacterized protein YhhL (DUF1145 family)
MVPVAACLKGTRLNWGSVALIGWFGPRGIASVLYLLLVVNKVGFAGYERIMSIIVLAVLLSVFLHGMSAVPLSRLYAAWTSPSADWLSIIIFGCQDSIRRQSGKGFDKIGHSNENPSQKCRNRMTAHPS